MSLLSIGVILVTVVLAFVSWQRSGKRGRTAVSESIRVAIVTAAVILLWQPETPFREPATEKEAVVVLVDQSRSMDTEDVLVVDRRMTRKQVAERVSSDSHWSNLDPRYDRQVVRFSNDTPQRSDIASAIEKAALSYPSAAAIVLVSDGDWNAGPSPVQTAGRMRSESISGPIFFTMPIGASQRLPDFELVSVDVPTFAVREKPVRIPFTLRNWFSRQCEVTVQLRVEQRVVNEQTFVIEDGDRVDGSFSWRFDSEGDFDVEVLVPIDDAETNRDNNSAVRQIQIRGESLRVLIVESTPRWEFRFLRNALIRDSGIEVSCLLFHPKLKAVGGGGTDYLDGFPTQIAELASYDVVFLGDVGMAADQLSEQQCRQLRGLVEQQAVGLVLMPGPAGRQSTFLNSPLEELFPVVLDHQIPKGIGTTEEGSMSLTAAGQMSLFTQLADQQDQNWSIWESLPGFYWHAPVVRAKAGSEVLAVHKTKANRYGRIAVLVSRPSGAGKVLFMGTDAAWRWRLGVEDKYHYRFWGQVIRWMAYQRNMAVGQCMRLSYFPEQPKRGDTVAVRASVMTEQGTPSIAESVELEYKTPMAQALRTRLVKSNDEWGVFTGQFRVDHAGRYNLLLKHPGEADSKVEANIVVTGQVIEQVGRPARSDIMGQIARVGGGSVASHETLEKLIKQINQLPRNPGRLRRIQWWNHPAVLLTMIAGLAVFWIARKWAGGV